METTGKGGFGGWKVKCRWTEIGRAQGRPEKKRLREKDPTNIRRKGNGEKRDEKEKKND